MNVQHLPQEQRWRLQWRDLLLILRLHDGELLTEYFSPRPSAAVAAPYYDTLLSTRAAAGVEIGPHGRGVVWSLVAWDRSNVDTLVIQLEATDDPLQAAVYFVVDAETGMLRRETMLRHAAGGLFERRGPLRRGDHVARAHRLDQ